MLRSIVAVVVVAVVAAVGGWWWYTTQSLGNTAPAAGRPGGPPGGFAAPVEAAPVRVGTAERQIVAVGSLRSNESVIIRPEVAGRVAELNIAEGQRVRRGQPLVRLDSTLERAQLAQAEAALQLSRANNTRAEELMRTGAGMQRNVDESRSRQRVDEAIVNFGRARLDKLTIEAPFDGVLGLRRISVGEFVQAGAEIVNLEMVDPLKVDFRVPELFLAAVATGQRVAIAVDAYPGRAFEGEVIAIDPAVDPGGRSVVIRARVPNTNDALRPGLFARVTLTLASRENAVFVPDSAIVPFGDQHFVFKVVEGRAVQTRVQLGERRRGEVEIREGLAAGDIVVTAGQIRVRDGVPVRVAPPPGQPPAQGSGQPGQPPGAGAPARPPQPAPAQARG
jgi:membrane fusion protein (multidrug efflux system)